METGGCWDFSPRNQNIHEGRVGVSAGRRTDGVLVAVSAWLETPSPQAGRRLGLAISRRGARGAPCREVRGLSADPGALEPRLWQSADADVACAELVGQSPKTVQAQGDHRACGALSPELPT